MYESYWNVVRKIRDTKAIANASINILYGFIFVCIYRSIEIRRYNFIEYSEEN